MGEGEIGVTQVSEVEGAWNQGGMGILGCIRASIGMSVCVLALVVVVVVVVIVLVLMVLMVWVVVGVLVVVVATVMVQEVLVEVVSGSSSGDFLVVVVVLYGFELASWSGWRVVLWMVVTFWDILA